MTGTGFLNQSSLKEWEKENILTNCQDQTPKVDNMDQRIAQFQNMIFKHCCYHYKEQNHFNTLLKCQFSFFKLWF